MEAYVVPTDFAESDGTLEWDRTTPVVVTTAAGGNVGTGYTYADLATAELVQQKLIPLVQGRDALQIASCWEAMRHAIRNLGRPGICSMAMAAVDSALWDLKANLLGVSLAPSLHVHACCALPRVRNIEYFHDHARIEKMFFEGAARAGEWAASSGFDPTGYGT